MLRCDWAALTDIPDGYQLLCRFCHLISYLRRTDPEAELQQQHGRAALPLPVSARIRGVPASEQQGDSALWQKQCARAAGECLPAAQRSRRPSEQPVPPLCALQRDDMEAVPGYLSLHQNADIMTLKWTPNQLMNGSVGDFDYERRCRMIT